MTQSNPIAAFASYQPHSAMMTARKRYRLPLSPPSREWQYIPVHSSKIKELPKISPNGGDDDDEDDVTYPSSFSSSEGTTFGDIEELIAADADVPPLLLDQSQKVTTITSVTTTSNFWTDFTATMPGDSILLLNIVAIIWGSQHAVIKTCIEDLNPSSFSLVRFLLAALIATPAWYLSKNENSDEASGDEAAAGTTSSSEIAIKSSTAESSSDLTTTWRWGVEMGLWMFLGYAFQAVGLAYTTAQRSGFFLYLNVKLVPFFAFVLLGRQISIPTWVSALTALAGTSLLAYDGTSLALNTGDLWSIAAAAASAMFILRLESASAQVPNAAALNASCLWVVTLASLIWSASLGLVTVDNMMDTLKAHPLELLYLSAVTTALANWIQTKAQKNVTAERASVIYAMDPVWGAIWANLLLGETLSGYGIVGAGFITVAAATNAFLDLGAKESSAKV